MITGGHMATNGSTSGGGSSWSKLAIGLLAAAGIIAAVVIGAMVLTGGDGGDESAAPPSSIAQQQADSAASESAPTDAPTQPGGSDGGSSGGSSGEVGASGADQVPLGDSETGAAIRRLAPNYGADGDGAVECMEQNTVGGFTDEELAIIRENPNAATWPPGLPEKFAAVLEECIPLEPFYLAQFGSFTFEDPACPRIMTDLVLDSWSWAIFIRKGILDADESIKLEAEFDAFVSNGYAANKCFAA